MRNLDFLFFEAYRTFRNELFLIQLKRKAIPEQDFRTTSKRNLASAIKFTKHNANSAFLRF